MLTQITDENIRYFYGLLGPYWDSRNDSDAFIGGIDEDGDAVSACVLEGDGMDLIIRFIAVTPSRQREGIGSEFLTDILMYAFNQGFRSLGAVYFKDENEDNGWEEFLKDCGFEVTDAGLTRNFFSFDEVKSKLKKDEVGLPDKYTIKRSSSLSTKETLELYDLEMTRDEKGGYFDAETVLSSDNRYGGVVFEDGKIAAAVSAIPFKDDLRLDTLLVLDENKELAGCLMNYVFSQVEKEKVPPKMICFETDDDEVSQRFLESYSKQGLHPIKDQKAYRAYREVRYGR